MGKSKMNASGKSLSQIWWFKFADKPASERKKATLPAGVRAAGEPHAHRMKRPDCCSSDPSGDVPEDLMVGAP
jgi:hypothetical protein